MRTVDPELEEWRRRLKTDPEFRRPAKNKMAPRDLQFFPDPHPDAETLKARAALQKMLEENP